MLSSFMQNIRQASERIGKTKKINADLLENISSMQSKNSRYANFSQSRFLNESSSGDHDVQQVQAAGNSIDAKEVGINSGLIKCIEFSAHHVGGHFQAVAETNQKVEYTDLGPRAWAARLHPRHFGLSGDGRVTLVVDPDRPAMSGEFGVLKSPSGFRVVSVKSTSGGKKFGSCLNSSEIIETDVIEGTFSSVVHIRM